MDWTALLSNEYIVGCVMAAIILGLTFLCKLPIKALTKKIANERARRIANSVILIIPFAFGLLAEFILSYFVLHTAFTGMSGLGYGTGAITMYAAIERFFKKQVGIQLDNPFDTEDGKAVQELVKEVKEDGKLDKSDVSAVEDFWKTISKDKPKSKK